MLIDADDPDPGEPIRAGCGERVSGRARIAIELTVCHDTPSSAAIAEMVVRSIINRQQHIPGTPPRRRGTRRRQLPEILG